MAARQLDVDGQLGRRVRWYAVHDPGCSTFVDEGQTEACPVACATVPQECFCGPGKFLVNGACKSTSSMCGTVTFYSKYDPATYGTFFESTTGRCVPTHDFCSYLLRFAFGNNGVSSYDDTAEENALRWGDDSAVESFCRYNATFTMSTLGSMFSDAQMSALYYANAVDYNASPP